MTCDVGLSCGVGRRCSLGLALLWLWRRPVAAVLIWPLAWELPYAAHTALKRQKNYLLKHKCIVFSKKKKKKLSV